MAGTRTTMKGQAVVITTAGALDAYANINIQNVKGSHDWSQEDIQDFEGFDSTWLARNEHIDITINVKLTGASKAAAITNGAFLVPLSAVTLSGFDLNWLNVTGVGGKYTGTWQFRSGSSLDLTNDKVGGMEIKLRKYADPTQNTASTTAAS